MFSKKKNQTEEPVKQEAAPSDECASGTADAQTTADNQPSQSAAHTAPAQEESPPLDELALMKDRYARLLADFDNLRKRQVRERAETIKRANEDLLGDLLPVLDHLEMALAQASDPSAPFVVGVQMVYDQFVTLLDSYGMVPLDALGEPFDPNYHEALSQIACDTVPANIIIEQFRRGWLLNGHLVRATQVVVSSGPPEGEEPADTAIGAEDEK